MLLMSGCAPKVSKTYAEDAAKKATASMLGEIGKVPVEKRIEVVKTVKKDGGWCVDITYFYRYPDSTKQGSITYLFDLKEPIELENLEMLEILSKSKTRWTETGQEFPIPNNGKIVIIVHPGQIITAC